MFEKLIATDGNRTYSFFLTHKDASQIMIEMYNSVYTLVLKDGQWVNHNSNKMTMAPNLIKAVIVALPA